jgi:hypothetical protein
MPNVNTEQTLTGNRAILRASNTDGSRVLGVGRVGNFQRPQDVTGNINTGLQTVSELGNHLPIEKVVGLFSFSITVNQLLLQRSISGFDPREMIVNSPIQIEVLDKQTGDELETFYNCTLATRNFNIAKHNFITGSLTFECLNASSGR